MGRSIRRIDWGGSGAGTSWTFPALLGIAYDVSNGEANARETLDIALAQAPPNGRVTASRATARG